MEGLTTDSLDFICPKPDRWHAIYKDLIRAYERKYNKKLPKTAPEIYASGGPPTPLILGGWWGSTVEAKRARWLETLQWAKLHDLESYTYVEEKDKYYEDF
ncbi:MAG: hypothetical protein ACOX4V_08900 [Anaerovoracaceae bacterium]|jgi:hypothetical protein